MMTRKSRRYLKNALIYICLFLVAILTLFPLIWGISASLRDDSELFGYIMPFSVHTLIPVEFTFQAYIDLFMKYGFFTPVKNTVLVTGISIIFGCIVNSVAAFAFAVFDFKFKKPLFALVLLSFMIPFEAIALPLYKVVDNMHMVDTYRGMILPSIASGLVLFLFVQFFRDIPPDLLDAARV